MHYFQNIIIETLIFTVNKANRTAFRARKVNGSFKKQSPGLLNDKECMNTLYKTQWYGKIMATSKLAVDVNLSIHQIPDKWRGGIVSYESYNEFIAA